MPVQTVLSGHTSPETAYVVTDYPYGFRLRCKIRYWIETTKHGQRVVSQTTNPKKPGEVWNKPKASTYTDLRVLFLDENGHVANEGLSLYYGDLAKVEAFGAIYGEALTSDRDKALYAVAKARAIKAEEMRAARAERGL